jgi:hypothetical protein
MYFLKFYFLIAFLFDQEGFVPSNMVWTTYLLIPLECLVEDIAPWVVLIGIWFVKLVSSSCTSFILSNVGIDKCRFISRIFFATIVWSDLSLASSCRLVLACALLQVSAVVLFHGVKVQNMEEKCVSTTLPPRRCVRPRYPATRRKRIE